MEQYADSLRIGVDPNNIENTFALFPVHHVFKLDIQDPETKALMFDRESLEYFLARTH